MNPGYRPDTGYSPGLMKKMAEEGYRPDIMSLLSSRGPEWDKAFVSGPSSQEISDAAEKADAKVKGLPGNRTQTQGPPLAVMPDYPWSVDPDRSVIPTPKLPKKSSELIRMQEALGVPHPMSLALQHPELQGKGVVGPSGTGSMRGPLLSESDIAAINAPKPVRKARPRLLGSGGFKGYGGDEIDRIESQVSLPEGYWGKEAPYNPYLDRPAANWPPYPGTNYMAQAWDRIAQQPEYKRQIAEAASKTVPGYVKAVGQAGKVLSHPATGAASSALGPLLSHVPVAQQYSGDMEQAIKRAGLQRAMELRPQMFAEPHMGPPKPKLHYDEAGWVVKKEPGDWDNLPQDPFQEYADMPQKEWEKEMGFGAGTVERGAAYSPSPFAFWNPPTYFPKTKEDLVKAWPVGAGPVPQHLLPSSEDSPGKEKILPVQPFSEHWKEYWKELWK